jgi:hypothetical protein
MNWLECHQADTNENGCKRKKGLPPCVNKHMVDTVARRMTKGPKEVLGEVGGGKDVSM